MNGPEFFMQHAGYRLLPPSLKKGDAVIDANTLLSINLPFYSGKPKRLGGCWMVVTPAWAATSFKLRPEAGFRHDLDFKIAKNHALRSGHPCILLSLGKRTMTARDLFVTYDPRAARECSQGAVRTFDATQEKTWTS